MGRPFNGFIAIPLTEKLLPLYGAQKRQETTPPAIILDPLWVDSGRFSGALASGIRVMRASTLITSVGRHFLCYR